MSQRLSLPASRNPAILRGGVPSTRKGRHRSDVRSKRFDKAVTGLGGEAMFPTDCSIESAARGKLPGLAISHDFLWHLSPEIQERRAAPSDLIRGVVPAACLSQRLLIVAYLVLSVAIAARSTFDDSGRKTGRSEFPSLVILRRPPSLPLLRRACPSRTRCPQGSQTEYDCFLHFGRVASLPRTLNEAAVRPLRQTLRASGWL
jgi:hypothetical protein